MRQNRSKTFDWKTFFASSMFFFVALVNPRDFPINNVPLVYPAFFLFGMLIGPDKILKGFKRTKFLCILLITYWMYFRMLILIKGGSIGLGDLAYILEPLMIFGAAGAATIKPGGTKAALWALVTMITLSTAFGIWIYFIGEPVASWRSTIHSSIGGSLLQGELMRDIDTKTDLAAVVVRNTGLSYFIFSFSYQIAVALLISLIGLLSMRRVLSFKKLSLLIGAFIILFVGMITNTERATVLSVSVGLLSFFLITKEKIFNARTIITFTICILAVMTLLNYSSKWEHRATLHNRSIAEEKTYVRAYMVIPAIASVFFEPLGAGGMSDYYEEVAYRVGWVTSSHAPKASHNHFANVIMYTGIVGIFFTILLFRGLWKKIKYIRLSALGEEEIILAVACIATIVHSFTHNAGFFIGERATHIVFGLLWGATAKTVSKAVKTRPVLPYNTFYPQFRNIKK